MKSKWHCLIIMKCLIRSEAHLRGFNAVPIINIKQFSNTKYQENHRFHKIKEKNKRKHPRKLCQCSRQLAKAYTEMANLY